MSQNVSNVEGNTSQNFDVAGVILKNENNNNQDSSHQNSSAKKKGIGKFLKNSLMKLRKTKKEQRPNIHQENNVILQTDESKDLLSKTIIPSPTFPEIIGEQQILQYQSLENQQDKKSLLS